MGLRLGFAGTPEFAATALRALLGAGYSVAWVLTQPDRPAGRGLQLHASAVKQVAVGAGLPVWQPRSLRLDGRYPEDAAQARAQMTAQPVDALVVAAYGLILPEWTLTLPRLGCLNIHASLLPRWRGAAPIQRAIEAGDAQTGVCIMQMDAGLDTGAVLDCATVPIAPTDTAASLHDRLADLGAQRLLAVLATAETAPLVGTPQPTHGVTYAAKISKDEALIDWRQTADVLVRRVRAFNPAPGAGTLWHPAGGAPQTLKVWDATVAPGRPADVPCGQIMAITQAGVAVAASNSIALLTQLQRPGGKRLDAASVARGLGLAPGQRLGAI